MPELAHWFKGRVLLMGDAAHAVAPHSGQGASMAIEDALVLAASLEADDTVEAGFAKAKILKLYYLADGAEAALEILEGALNAPARS